MGVFLRKGKKRAGLQPKKLRRRIVRVITFVEEPRVHRLLAIGFEVAFCTSLKLRLYNFDNE